MHAPRTRHLQAVKRILRYVKGTISLGLQFRTSLDSALCAFCDVDWAGDVDNHRSTTGVSIFFGPNLVAWSAKKQTTVTHSSSEAKYRAFATTAAELRWFSFLYRELSLFLALPIIYCDNISAIHMSRNPIFHARTRHAEIGLHFVRELQQCGFLRVAYVPANDQLADVFAKGLARPRLDLIITKLQPHDVPLGLQGGNRPSLYNLTMPK